MFAHRGSPEELVPSKLPKFYFLRCLLGKLWGPFKASHNLLLAFFSWKALQAFKALQAWKGLQALKALRFLQSFPQFAVGVLFGQLFASLQSFASLERFASLGVPSKLPTICIWRSFFGQLFASLQSFASLERFASLESFGVPPKSFSQFAFGVLYLDSSLAWL